MKYSEMDLRPPGTTRWRLCGSGLQSSDPVLKCREEGRGEGYEVDNPRPMMMIMMMMVMMMMTIMMIT